MRRGMLAAGVGAGIMAIGVPAASAADIPVSISFTGGKTTIGTATTSLAPFDLGTAASPATLAGTLSTTTFGSSFPAGSIKLPSRSLGNVALTGIGTGTVTLQAEPTGAFTGTLTTPSSTSVSLNLAGPVTYRLQFTPAGASAPTATCALTPGGTLSLTGAPIDLKSGAYSVAGQVAIPNVAAAPALTDLVTQGPTCLQLTSKVAGTTTKVTGSGTIAVQGLIPLPAATTPTPTPSGTGTTSPGTTTPAELGPAQLALVATKPKTVKRGRSTTFRFAVANGGGVAAKSVKVTFKTPKGVKVAKRTIKRSTLAAGTFKTYTVRLRTTKKAKKSGKVTLTARASGGLRATARTTLKLR